MSVGSQKSGAGFFKPLEQGAFQSMKHAASLKGLLKPFKGKGALEEWASQCEGLRDQLVVLGRQEVLAQVSAYPFALLPVQLAFQTTGAGTAFLRWRTVDRSVMGVHLWDELMQSQSTPAHLTSDLYAAEMQRIVLNMQISLVHTIARQARECAVKAAHAQGVFEQRMK